MRRQLTCPACQVKGVCDVVDSRTDDDEITLRRYTCRACRKSFKRWESRLDPALVQVRPRRRRQSRPLST